eukprot:103140-Pleurochrysis_carterae.AAC.1
MRARARREGYGGVLKRGRAQRALREGHLARERLLEGVAHAREQPQEGVVVEARPPSHAAPVAAVGRVLDHPRRPRRLR